MLHYINRNRTRITPIFVEKYTWLVLTWLAFRAAADLIICCAMASLLRARRTGFRRYVSPLPVPHIAHCVFMACSTDTALNIMVLWTINTGVATALSSVVDLIVVSLAFVAVKLPHITD